MAIYTNQSVVNHLIWLWRGWLLYLVIRFLYTTNCSLALPHHLCSIYFLIDINCLLFSWPICWRLVELATVSRGNDKTDLPSWEQLNYMHIQISCTNMHHFLSIIITVLSPVPWCTFWWIIIWISSSLKFIKILPLKKRLTMHTILKTLSCYSHRYECTNISD